MQTSTDYTNRKVDLSIFPGIQFANLLADDALGPNSRSIAGPSKVAQNFLRLLMTPLGSYPSDLLLGSNFMLRLRNGSIKLPIDLQQAFSAEALRVTEWMSSHYGSAPDDEKIASVSLENFTINRGMIQLTINLTTQADSNATFLLPVVWNN